jgi:C4-dicarboxylate-specific signal transduction histidine kinase
VPADCNIRYRPETLWAEHQDIILLSLAVFVAQALTIAGLLTQRRQRRLAEIEVLNQRMELAHVSRVSTMGQLASALAHELNQPLGAILRNAEAGELFLQKEKPDLDEIRAILADIRKDDERAGNVINRMRSLLKRRSLESDPLDFHGLIEETIQLARPDAVTRKMSLSMRAAPELPLVLGDRVHLQQVLLNLMLNGMDAMKDCRPADRLLSILARVTAEGTVEVVVKDRGTGIPADKVARVFEPFFTTKSDGMGMGLAISQTIIEAHGGTIHAENNPDKGASFIFILQPAA